MWESGKVEVSKPAPTQTLSRRRQPPGCFTFLGGKGAESGGLPNRSAGPTAFQTAATPGGFTLPACEPPPRFELVTTRLQGRHATRFSRIPA